jgi:PBP1b-binding outer membrane lipoprotein LpoB
MRTKSIGSLIAAAALLSGCTPDIIGPENYQSRNPTWGQAMQEV